MLVGVVLLETIMAIDIAAPFGKRIADNWPKLAGMDKRMK
jgi:hypothetical protein